MWHLLLVTNLERKYESEPQVQWLTYLPPEFDGEKHPAGRGITKILKEQ